MKSHGKGKMEIEEIVNKAIQAKVNEIFKEVQVSAEIVGGKVHIILSFPIPTNVDKKQTVSSQFTLDGTDGEQPLPVEDLGEAIPGDTSDLDSEAKNARDDVLGGG